MFNKQEKEKLINLINDRVIKLRSFILDDGIISGDKHSAIVELEHLSSAKAKIEMEVIDNGR